jgi:hypothetical protein
MRATREFVSNITNTTHTDISSVINLGAALFGHTSGNNIIVVLAATVSTVSGASLALKVLATGLTVIY